MTSGGPRDIAGEYQSTRLDTVRASITGTDATVILVTGDDIAVLRGELGTEKRRLQPRPNVAFEAGWALALRPASTVLVQVGPADVMSNIYGLNVPRLTNSVDSRREVMRSLRSTGLCLDEESDLWARPQSGGDFSAFDDPNEDSFVRDTAGVVAERVERLQLHNADSDVADESRDEDLRGLTTEYIFDSALSARLSSPNLLSELRDRLRKGAFIDLKYHYVGPRMAQYWIDVTKDPGYGHELLLATTGPSVREILKAASLASRPFDYISLGPGVGKFDEELLSILMSDGRLGHYYPVDMSLDLLQVAVTNVQRRLHGQDLRMRAFFADFEDGLDDLTIYMRSSELSALFALTGFALGNSREDTPIESIRNAMRPGDSLLIDARLHPWGQLGRNVKLSEESAHQMMAPYDSAAQRQFAFGPVEVAGDFTITSDDVEIKMDPRVGGVSAVPHAVNVLVQCHGLYNLERHAKFLERLGYDVKDTSHQGQLRARRQESVDLAMTTFYDFESLKEWFGNHELRVAWSMNADDTLGVFLLVRD